GLIGAASFAEGEDTDRGQPLNSIDPPKLVAGLTYDAPGRAWGGQLVGTFVDGKKHIDQTTAPVPLASPGYAVFDLIGYWNASKRGSLHVGLFNLTDRKYFLWSDLQGLGGGAAGIAGPAALDRFSQPGRNLRVTYKHRFRTSGGRLPWKWCRSHDRATAGTCAMPGSRCASRGPCAIAMRPGRSA